MKKLAQYLAEGLEQELSGRPTGGYAPSESDIWEWVKNGIEAYESTEGVTVRVVKTDKEMHGATVAPADGSGYVKVILEQLERRGYVSGDYDCRCSMCHQRFEGSKECVVCHECAFIAVMEDILQKDRAVKDENASDNS